MNRTVNLEGRVAVVTGGGNGLGRAHCLALARHGARVLVNDLGADTAGAGVDRDAAEQVVAEIRAFGGEAAASHASVATREGGAAIIARAIEQFGRIDALVNNAGYMADGAFEELDDHQIDGMLDVHVRGAFHVTQPAFRAMKKAGYGRIVFTGSSSAMFGHAWHAAYGAAKGALFGLCNVVAIEGQPHSIRANLVMPSALTRLSTGMKAGFIDNADFAKSVASVDLDPLMPAMLPDYAASLVVYLASEACASTHNLYSQMAHRYSRVFIGVTDGWQAPSGGPPSPDDIADHWDEIEGRETYHLPLTNYDEMAIVSPARRNQ